MRPLVLALMLVAAPLAQESRLDTANGKPLPDFNTFAAQVRKHLATDEERQSGYVYIERRTEQKVDGSGRPTSESVKSYEVYPGLPGQERYRRLVGRRGKKRALVAVAHSLLRSIFVILRDRVPYRELGADHYRSLHPQRQVKYHLKRLEALGVKVELAPAA